MPTLLYFFLLGTVLSAIVAHHYGFKGRQFVVGVDLGTTYSVIAIKRTHDEGGVVEVIPIPATGKLLLPSVVAYIDGKEVVGTAALPYRMTHPDHTVYNAKRFIGRTYETSSAHAAEVPYSVSENGTGPVFFPLAGRNVTPVNVGTSVVKVMFDAATKYLGYEPRGAVICVPAKFGEAQTAATAAAFEAAGLKVQRIMDEPTAAAVAYNLHRSEEARNVVVYDIGGGTTDVSMLFMNQGSVTVLGTTGDEHLGGSDFDTAMYELLVPLLKGCPGPELRVLAEEAKISLSSSDDTVIACGTNRSIPAVTVTRKMFEAQSEPLFVRSMVPVDLLLEQLMMKPKHVNDVVLVGGASRTPHLRALLRAKFDGRVHHDIDPDVTVAWGAANILD